MPYAYCPECGNGLNPPSISEAVAGTRDCPHCQEEIDVPTHHSVDAFERLEERVAALEARHSSALN